MATQVVPARRAPAHRRPAAHRALEEHADALAAVGVRGPASRRTRRSAPRSSYAASTAPGALRRETSRAPGARSAAGPTRARGDVVVGHELLAGAARRRDRAAGRRPGRDRGARRRAGRGRPTAGWASSPTSSTSRASWTAGRRRSSCPTGARLVVADPADPGGLWRALGALVGFDADPLPLPTPGTVGPDATGIAVLRSVNRAVDGRLDTRTSGASYAATSPRARPSRTSADRRPRRTSTTSCSRSASAGASCSPRAGTTSAATPRRCCRDRRTREATLPDDVRLDDRLSVTTDALAEVLVEAARLREHTEALQPRNAKLREEAQEAQAAVWLKPADGSAAARRLRRRSAT